MLIATFEYQRIGKQRDGNKPRILKVTLPNNEIREHIMKDAPLKNIPGIYIQESIYKSRYPSSIHTRENQIIRKHMNDLRHQPKKIVKGILETDGVPDNKNIFL